MKLPAVIREAYLAKFSEAAILLAFIPVTSYGGIRRGRMKDLWIQSQALMADTIGFLV
jgi:hypothetical protein